jgi:hypothetical protein
MKNPRMLKRQAGKLLAAVFLLMVSPFALFAQNGATSPAKPLTIEHFVGNYKGTAKRPAGDISFTLEIKSENGKTSGRLIAPQHAELQITSGEIIGNKLTLKLSSGDHSATLVLQLADNKLVGEWKSGEQTGAVELIKAPAEPSLAEMLSGEWDGAADVQGEAFPFSLSLKVEGDRVTGSSSSELGTSTISSGTVKDGKLVFLLDSPNGQIAMIAALEDGKLIGDFDFAGQMQGKWVATKRKP